MNRRSAPVPPAPRLFDDAAAGPPPAGVYVASIDGASRGNPGLAAYAVVMRDANRKAVIQLAKRIGRVTNNVAEYFGLIAALDYATAHGITALRIRSDSELLVRQMQGRYKVKSPELRPLHERAVKMARQLAYFQIEHIMREFNHEADELANFALDQPGDALIELGPTIGKPLAAVAPAAAAQPAAAEPAGPEPPRDSWAPPLTLHGIKAKFVKGVLVPANSLDLPEGASVTLNLRINREE